MRVGLAFICFALRSVQPEVDLHTHLYGYGLTIFRAGFKSPQTDRFDSLFVQSHAERARDADVVGLAIGPHYYLKLHSSLPLILTGFFAEFRIDPVDNLGSADAISNVVSVAADSAAPSRTNARTTS